MGTHTLSSSAEFFEIQDRLSQSCVEAMSFDFNTLALTAPGEFDDEIESAKFANSNGIPVADFDPYHLERRIAEIESRPRARTIDRHTFRIYARANQWRGDNATYGGRYHYKSQYLGNQAEPSFTWSSGGDIVPKGAILHSIKLFGRTNSTQVTALDYRFAFRHGPWGGGWDSNGETVFSPVAGGSWDLTDGDDSANYQRTEIDLGDFVAPEDGFFMPAFRAQVTSDSARYWYGAAIMELTL